jgi:hypothetical protein
MKLFNPRYQDTDPFNAAAQAREQEMRSAERRTLLMIASHILDYDQRNPEAVLANARFLMSWLDEAGDALDRSNRMAALSRADKNLQDPRDNEPLAFLEDAKRYYEFLAAA